MTWHVLSWIADRSNDVVDAYAKLMLWLLLVDDVVGQPGSVSGIRAKKERVARRCAWAVLTLTHAARRFFTGFSPVDLSRLPLHDGMFKNTF